MEMLQQPGDLNAPYFGMQEADITISSSLQQRALMMALGGCTPMEHGVRCEGKMEVERFREGSR